MPQTNMDPRKQRYHSSGASAEYPTYYSSSSSHPDLLSSQWRPSPLRNNISVSDDEPQGYRSYYSTSLPAVNHHPYPPQISPTSHSQNPFSSPSPGASPRHSVYDFDVDSFGQNPYGSHHRTMGSYGEFIDQEFNLQPFGGRTNGEGASEIASDIRSELPTESNSNTSARRQKHEFKSYLLNGQYVTAQLDGSLTV
jgi:hypothetical protein